MLPFIDLKAQYRAHKVDIDRRIQRVLDHGQFILGPEVGELESALAEYCGVPHAIGVSDGTTALLIAMMALEIGPGDEVVTTPFSFFATAEMISLLGASPVFADIDPRTYNLDPSGIEAALTARTRAIMPVGLFGQSADLNAIKAIADRHGLAVIEDAAQSFGATIGGESSFAFGTISCTSFFPSKPLGCYGDGGACFTADAALANRMRQIRSHGQTQRYRHAVIGLNGRLDTLQAAVLLAKLPGFPAELHAREAAAERYCALLDQESFRRAGVHAPFVVPGHRSVYAQYTLRVRERDRVVARLAADGIPSAVHYPVPLHRQAVYAAAFAQSNFPVAEKAAEEVLSLPMHPYLGADDQQRIVDSLSNALRD